MFAFGQDEADNKRKLHVYIVMLNKFLKTIEKITPPKFRWILNHDGFKRYFANTGWMFFGKVFSISLSFLVGVYIARYLGPANYGLFNYVISFVGLFSFITSFGIDSIVSREIIKNHNLKDKIIGTGFFLKLFGSFLAILSVVGVSFFTTKDTLTLVLIFLFSLSYIPLAFNVVDIYFQSQVLSKNSVRAQILASVISAILKIFCIYFQKGIIWLLSVYVLETLLLAIFLIIAFKRQGHSFRLWKFNKNIALLLLKNSWPLMLSSVAIGIYMKIDQVIIKNMLGNEQAGIYSVAVKIAEVWYFIPSLICLSLFPAIVNAKKVGCELYKNRLKKLYRLMFWMSLSFAALVSFFSRQIIWVLFGEVYLGAASTLSLYAWTGVTVSLGVALSQYLVTENYTKISAATTVFGAISNVGLNFLFIPKYGIMGAAMATLLSYLFSVFGIFLFRKTRNHGILILKSIINF